MEVYALVGPAGTGKSHRASLVAHRFGAEAIVDDGLLVARGAILAGVSAKREQTAVAAVRRAVFADPEHARAVREALHGLAPERVLVLGTSREMVDRICDALDLPRPERYLDIAEVAPPDEIRRAQRTRRLEGRHVIPAPTFEVRRKGFSGYLVDPLRFLYSGRGRREEVLVEKSTVRPTYSALGRFFIADSVVAAIAERAAREVDGVVGATRVQVQQREEGVVLTLDLALRYGLCLPPVLEQARARVREVVENLTALNVLEVTVVARRVVPEAGEEAAAREAEGNASGGA